MLLYNKELKEFPADLRKNMADAENVLWSEMRGKQINGLQFYRQKNIGNYVVDFYCPSAKLIVELDGGQHYSDEGKARDSTRDQYLTRLGFRVLRFFDRGVYENLDGVLQVIFEQTRMHSKAKSPLPPSENRGDGLRCPSP